MNGSQQRQDVVVAPMPTRKLSTQAENGTFDTEALIHTREYLKSAIDGISRAENSRELTDFLLAAYPDRENKGVVELGAKVLMGELQWG